MISLYIDAVGPKPFAPRDRSSFLSALDQAIVRLSRGGIGAVGG
jgi:hypothetical protein